MKWITRLLLGLAVVISIGIGNVNAAMSGGAHDLTANALQAGADKGLCRYCHAPHNTTQTTAPLWNRVTTTNSFTLYTSPTMNATAAVAGLSRGCLSCHDGVTALDNLAGQVATGSNTMADRYPGSAAILGQDLSNDHPVGVLITADSTGIENASTITAGGLKVFSDKVECASCHDVHFETGYNYGLWVDPAGGTLCEVCHTK